MAADQSTPCLSLAELQAAESGELASERLRHLATCPLCAAAFEGLTLASEDVREELLSVGPERSARPALEEATIVTLPHADAAFGHGGSRRAKSIWLWPGLAMVASIIVGVVLLSDLHRNGSTSVTQAEFVDDFNSVVEPFARRERGEADTASADAYLDAASAYERGEFAAAAQAYRDEISRESSPLHDTRGYYELGITNWRLGQFDSAADYLTRARMGEAEYFEDASWALARVYLLLRDTASAAVVLQDLEGLQQSPYADKATRLLDGL